MLTKYKPLQNGDVTPLISVDYNSVASTVIFELPPSVSENNVTSITKRNIFSKSSSAEVALSKLCTSPKSISRNKSQRAASEHNVILNHKNQTNIDAYPCARTAPTNIISTRSSSSSRESIWKYPKNILAKQRCKSKSPEDRCREKNNDLSNSSLGKALLTCGTVSICSTGIITPEMGAQTQPLTRPNSATRESPVYSQSERSSYPATNSKSQQIDLRKELEFELVIKVGPKKCRRLLERHVKRSHFLILNADKREDQEMADRVRRLLENCQQKTKLLVSGRWDIFPGEFIPEGWQRLMDSATTVIMILSRALFKDLFPTLCYPEALFRNKDVVPIFLEQFTDQEIDSEFPPVIRSIRFKNGAKKCNIEAYVRRLSTTFDYNKHYGQEIEVFVALIEKLQNSNYVCPCGLCME